MTDNTFARVVDGTVHGAPIALPDKIGIAAVFPSAEAALYHPCGPEVGDGWAFDGKAFTAPSVAEPTADELAARARAAWSALLAEGQTFQIAPQGAAPVTVLCDGTNDTRADLALLALFGQANPAGKKTWLDNAGRTTDLTGAELVSLATLAGNWVGATYPALANLLGEIASGAVTTTAQVDAFAWPTS